MSEHAFVTMLELLIFFYSNLFPEDTLASGSDLHVIIMQIYSGQISLLLTKNVIIIVNYERSFGA